VDGPAAARTAGERALLWFGRASKVLLVAALGAWGLWLVAANALLCTPLLRAIVNANRPTIQLDYRFAWSVWPCVAHVRGLEMISQDRAVQWRLSIERASTTIAVWQLPAKAFHATTVRASGVQFALRRRIPKPEITPERLEGLPLIAGFDRVPVAEEGPDEEIPDWFYRLFTVWLENVDARDVREIWVDQIRIAGAARLAGSFYLKPIRRVLLDPGVLGLDGAALEFAAQNVATDLRGELLVRLHPFDPRGLTFPALARAADVDSELTGRLSDLEFLSRLLPLSGGEGPIRAAVHVQAGQILPGTAIAADLRDAIARPGGVPVRVGRVAVSFEARPPSSARAALDLSSIRAGEAASIASVRVGFEGDAPDLAQFRPPRAAHVVVEGGRVIDARAAAALAHIPESVRVAKGHGDFAVALDGPLDAMRGMARFALSELQLEVSDTHVAAEVEVRAVVRSFDPARGGDLDGTQIDVSRARIVNPGGEEDTAPEWWAHLTLPRAALRERAIDAELAGRCRDARPIVGLYVRRSQLPGFLSGLFAMDDLAVRGSALVTRESIALRDVSAIGDGASIRGAYRADSSGKRGAALLEAHGITVGVSLGDAGSSLHVGAASDWFADAEAKLQPRRAVPPLARTRRPAQKRAAPPVQTAR
jgi:hypothetical protein